MTSPAYTAYGAPTPPRPPAQVRFTAPCPACGFAHEWLQRQIELTPPVPQCADEAVA